MHNLKRKEDWIRSTDKCAGEHNGTVKGERRRGRKRANFIIGVERGGHKTSKKKESPVHETTQ